MPDDEDWKSPLVRTYVLLAMGPQEKRHGRSYSLARTCFAAVVHMNQQQLGPSI